MSCVFASSSYQKLWQAIIRNRTVLYNVEFWVHSKNIAIEDEEAQE